ncbi:MAG TPA: hypothetical protein VKT80_10195 [Chloroflexota bacterium]|nr:hypothetical protein [Chloroflexota bacterium]
MNRVRAAVTDPSETPYPARSFGQGLQLEFHGNSETDVGYVKDEPGPNLDLEKSNDFRGRFVLGADLDYGFGQNFFFHGRGQLVDWIREPTGGPNGGLQYLVNADDVFVQVGQRKIWDFLIGRFMTWKIYRKGLGFDIYTLEDTGALDLQHRSNDVTASPFFPHVYGVDDIWLRGTQGRAGFHVYPTPWSGLEFVGEYGRVSTINSLGGRGAGRVDVGPVSATAGFELKHVKPAIDNPGCDQCGINNFTGYGGGLVLDLNWLEVGGNIGIRNSTIYGQTMPSIDKSSSGKTTSVGGYLELDPGLLAMNRSLIVGVGVNQTQVDIEAGDKKKHVQEAAYIAFPLGFNDAMIKFVLSRADGTGDPRAADEYKTNMIAGRFRVSFTY